MKKLITALVLVIASVFTFAGCTEITSVEGIKLDKESLSLYLGETQTLKATVTPDSASDKTVRWTSSAEEIATVDEEGNVTAVAEGSAIIIAATADGGFTAICEVTVQSPTDIADDAALQAAIASQQDGQIWTLTGESYSADIDLTAAVRLVGVNDPVLTGKITVTADGVEISGVSFAPKAGTGEGFATDSYAVKATTAGKITLTDNKYVGTNKIRTPFSLSVGSAEIVGNTFDSGDSLVYNLIEFGISNGNDLSEAVISDNTFSGACANNCISIYNLAEEAAVTLENNTFGFVGNALRLSNPRNVSATFDIIDNTYESTLEGEYAGFLILQDYSKANEGETVYLQDFSKFTITFENLVMAGEELTENGTGTKQVYYVYDDQDGIITVNQPNVIFA